MAGAMVYEIWVLLTKFGAMGQRSGFYPPSSPSPNRCV
jgi:hypothetical protein